MTIEAIVQEVGRLRKTYGDLPPEDLCRQLAILLSEYPMGDEPTACKGFFLVQFGVPLIMLNSSLSEEDRGIVLWHELGHAMLHRDLAESGALRDFSLFDNTDRHEWEANIFAAEALLPDDAVRSALDEGLSFFDAASMLRVPPELLDFKFRILKQRGWSIQPPLYAQSNFLKKIGRADAV